MLFFLSDFQNHTTCVFNQFQIYDNNAEKGGVGGLKYILLYIAY